MAAVGRRIIDPRFDSVVTLSDRESADAIEAARVSAVAGPDLGELALAKLLAQRWGGLAEVRLDDETRVDILTDEFAIEVDFPRKWAEAIGQALHYGDLTGKRPGVALLVSNPAKEWRGVMRCAMQCGKLGIRLWAVDVASLGIGG